MIEFSPLVLRVFMMTLIRKSEKKKKNDEGKYPGWRVTSYGPDLTEFLSCSDFFNQRTATPRGIVTGVTFEKSLLTGGGRRYLQNI